MVTAPAGIHCDFIAAIASGGEAVIGRDAVGWCGRREQNRTAAAALEAGADLGREEDEEGSDGCDEGIVLPRTMAATLATAGRRRRQLWSCNCCRRIGGSGKIAIWGRWVEQLSRFPRIVKGSQLKNTGWPWCTRWFLVWVGGGGGGCQAES